MPNQRDPDKVKLSAWIGKKEMELLKAYAKANNQNITEVIKDLVHNLPKKLELDL